MHIVKNDSWGALLFLTSLVTLQLQIIAIRWQTNQQISWLVKGSPEIWKFWNILHPFCEYSSWIRSWRSWMIRYCLLYCHTFKYFFNHEQLAIIKDMRTIAILIDLWAIRNSEAKMFFKVIIADLDFAKKNCCSNHNEFDCLLGQTSVIFKASDTLD